MLTKAQKDRQFTMEMFTTFIAPPIAGVAAGIYIDSAFVGAAVAAAPALVYAVTPGPYGMKRLDSMLELAFWHATLAAGITAVIT